MQELVPIGWREWVSLPELGVRHLKAKIDTGARTSALHAASIEVVAENFNKKKVRFILRPYSRYAPKKILHCSAELLDMREVTDSGGHKEQRCVIRTPLVIGKYIWPIEITLTSRNNMRFKMLIGRTALKNRFLVDSGRSFLIV